MYHTLSFYGHHPHTHAMYPANPHTHYMDIALILTIWILSVNVIKRSFTFTSIKFNALIINIFRTWKVILNKRMVLLS